MAEIAREIRECLARARLLALDVDGTLTPGRVVYAGGVEVQSFCVHDGQGLVWLRRAGVVLAWISGRGCDATRRRAAELGVDELHLKVRSKSAVLQEIQRRLGIAAAETVAMGDDLPDLALAAGSGVFACPADARPEVRERADLVTAARAGEGAARELAEALLRARDQWDGTLERYRG